MRRNPLLIGAALAVLCAPTRAHEPLWAENASTVGPKIWHFDVRAGWDKTGPLKSGSRSVSNPTAMRESSEWQMLMVDYGVSSKLNLRAMIDRSTMTQSEIRDGVRLSRSTGGVGDFKFGAKYRFRLRLAEGQKDQHTALFLVSLPTGGTGERGLNGRLAPNEQPGAGKAGIHLGYAYNHEWLKDTVWVSAMLEQYPGDGYRRGSHFQTDAAYGRWVKYANRPEDLAAVLALGLHYERSGKDHDGAARLADTGGEMVGLHLTGLVTRVPWMVRAGYLIPISRRVNGTQIADGPQLRIGGEMFF